MSTPFSAFAPSVLAAAMVHVALVQSALQSAQARVATPPAPRGVTGGPRRMAHACPCCGGPAAHRVGSASLAASLDVAVGDRVCAPCISAAE